MKKKLSEITRADWTAFRWIEVSEMGDEERIFLVCGWRNPEEAAQAMADWDSTAEEREAARSADIS
jgi:hypothetical protein